MNRQAIHFASAAGAISCLSSKCKPKSRRHRVCEDLFKALMERVDHSAVEDSDLDIARKLFPVIERTAQCIINNSDDVSADEVLIALALFNLEEIDEIPYVRRRMNKVLECWPKVYEYEATRAGHRVWQRIETELNFFEMKAEK